MFEEKYGTAKRRLKSEDFSSNTNNENLKINKFEIKKDIIN